MIDDILNRLSGVKRKGQNSWMACCPAHDDSDPSLAVTSVDDGRILLKCFAGCSALEVVHALGLELKDLFPQYGLNPYGTMKNLQSDYENKNKLQKAIEKAKTVWMIYQSDKKRGVKYSQQDKNTVLNAYQFLRENNAL